jgi:hypothetical protein
MTFISFASHRARDRAFDAWKDAGLPEPQAFYSLLRLRNCKGTYQVTDAHLAALAGGYAYGARWYTRVRGPHDDLMRCWPKQESAFGGAQ